MPVDLSKLRDIIKNNIIDKTQHDQLAKKGNATDTCRLVKKTDYKAEIKEIEAKIPHLATTTTSLNA